MLPAGWSVLQNKNLRISVKIFESEYSIEKPNNIPGTIINDGKKIIKVATSDGFIFIKSLQVEGKKRMQAEEFLRGFHDIESCQFVDN